MGTTPNPSRLAREITVEVIRAADDQPATFTAALSSEEVCPRWFGREILDHGPDAVNLERASAGLPLLFGHDPDQIVGRVHNLRIQDRRLRGDLRFYSTPKAREVETLVTEGHREMSVSYTIERMRLEGEDEGVKTFRAVRWTLLEASVVGVPADASVGIGRSAADDGREMPPVEPPAPTRSPIDPDTRAEQAAPLTDTSGAIMDEAKAPASQVADIITLGERFAAQGGDRAAAEYLRSGRSDLGEFQARLLERIGTSASQVQSDLGMSHADRERFSIVRLVRALANPSDRGAREAAAFEFEASEAALKAQGRGLRGNAQATIPMDVLFAGSRDLIVATSTLGGYTVGTDTLGGSFVDVLRNQAFTVAAGATVLTGLQGAVAIPTKTAAVTAYWVAEGTAPTEGAIVFGQITMSPKTVGAWVDFSRKLMLQSSIDVEAMVRNDLYAQIGVAIDAAALAGAGTGSEPSGILTSTSVGTATAGTNGGAPTWQLMVDLETAVANGNADRGALAYFVNSKTRGKLKTVTKSTSAVAGFVWEGGETPINGYRTYVTNQLSSSLTKGTSTAICSAAVFGNWQDLVIGQWGGLDLLVDPYTASNTGTVRVVALQDVDVAIRRNASFAYIKDLLTT